MYKKINFNKSIRDKELKILAYYKKKNSSILETNKLPKLKKKKTKKQIDITTTSASTSKLTKLAKLPESAPPKQKIVEMD